MEQHSLSTAVELLGRMLSLGGTILESELSEAEHVAADELRDRGIGAGILPADAMTTIGKRPVLKDLAPGYIMVLERIIRGRSVAMRDFSTHDDRQACFRLIDFGFVTTVDYADGTFLEAMPAGVGAMIKIQPLTQGQYDLLAHILDGKSIAYKSLTPPERRVVISLDMRGLVTAREFADGRFYEPTDAAEPALKAMDVLAKEKTHYRIIRAGMDYNPVIVVSPPDAGPSHPDAIYYERRNWGPNPNQFIKITQTSARMAFSGHADGWGFASIPGQTFETLAAVAAWIEENRRT